MQLKYRETMRNTSAVHLWMPDIFEFKGGIQVYSAFLLEAMQAMLPHYQQNVFLKHDSRRDGIAKGTAPAAMTDHPHTSFHFSGQWHPSLRTPAFATAIATAGLIQRPNLILSTHINFTKVAYWLKQIAGIPYWAVAHGVDAWNIENTNLQKSLSHADLILAVSGYTRDRLLQEQNLDPKKVVVLPNTFDVNRFQVATKPDYLLQRYQLKPEQPIILTVARLDSSEQYKGYDRILQAMPKIRQHIPDVHYLIVGKGSDRYRIEQLIQKLDIEDCVTLAGFVADEELASHYHLCDIFAMPSKGEGFGIVYLEALACGKPTLGGNQDGAIDALCGGKLGILVDPDNVEEIAMALIQTLTRTYSHPLIYRPTALRQGVIDAYGFQQFQKTLEVIWQTHHRSKH
jgi:glycosyltransferase involved in cell wall biosynthesis